MPRTYTEPQAAHAQPCGHGKLSVADAGKASGHEEYSVYDETLEDIAVQAAMEAQCLIHGHSLECQTVAGPESGEDLIWCQSCGTDFSVSYY